MVLAATSARRQLRHCELVVAAILRRIDIGRHRARGGADDRAGIAGRPHGRQEGRIHAAVAAGGGGHARDAAVNQPCRLKLVAALFLADLDRDVVVYLLYWATLGRAEACHGYCIKYIELLAYVCPG